MSSRPISTLPQFLVAVAGLFLSSSATAQSSGQWAGPYDWASQLNPMGCDTIAFDEISHAVVIPTGRYRGAVMMWREGVSPTACVSAMETVAWIVLPDEPSRLLRIEQSIPYDIFCSGSTWDTQGRLIIAGGHPFSAPPPDHAIRFDPRKLDAPRPPAKPRPPGAAVDSGYRPAQTVPGQPWSTNIPMSIGRYYPTLLTLDRRPILSECLPDKIEGGSQLALGGWPGGPNGNEGNELWQFLEPNASVWSRTLTAPPGLPGSHDPSGITETYSLVPAHGAPGSPEYLFDSYPRAFQMAEFDPALPVNGQIFVMGDIETTTTPPQPTTGGRTWVIKPPASTTSGCWELRRGPQCGNDFPPGTNERWYGSAVLLHTLAARNRVLVLGGSQPTAGPDYNVNFRVQEFTPSSAPGSEPIADGTWALKVSLIHPRVYPNAVVLPTGRIFVEGGFGVDYVHNTSQIFPCLPLPCPRPIPEIYDPGAVGELGTTTALAPSNLVAPYDTSMPRGYHHVAALLSDGRVFVGGGGNFRQPNPHVYPISHYSGEIYSPPYLFQGPRPEILSHPESAVFSTSVPSTFPVTIQVNRDRLDRIVLTRPASVTHHFDVDQRYIELEFSAPTYTSPQEITATVTAPHESLGPPGWYMLWAVEADAPEDSANLLPSNAQWIRLE